jgi:hypothetical protein
MLGVHQVYYTRFKKIIKKADDLKQGNDFVPYKTNGSDQKIHAEHPHDMIPSPNVGYTCMF